MSSGSLPLALSMVKGAVAWCLDCFLQTYEGQHLVCEHNVLWLLPPRSWLLPAASDEAVLVQKGTHRTSA